MLGDMIPYPLPDLPRRSLDSAQPVDRTTVGAALITEDGRFLLQRRDPKPDIVLPDHWCFFAGGVEPGETPDQAIWREVEEELCWRPAAVRWLCESVGVVPRPHHPVVRRVWYVAELPVADLPKLRQQEGAGMALFDLPGILALEKIAPWDLQVAVTIVRHPVLFPPSR